ncbi:outer membrane protein, multidrug efflux system [Thermodesulfovibrio aggregans]|uniref:Outer membrane protein, multidrug efflux system n=1 Tax=Thermodesulfovibrio aggregans TaxID=86166 RepID=A0A0U9HX56_9BACT|nr:efflux transporter outer membrane subunit [Thermodesulfovibrio aggregans]GAQ95697.1 outer membrane protein, multidrug efflux system [Thermodesulfovibrio aggregans]
MRKLIIPLILLLLTSCTMIPEYKRPEAPIPREWPKGEAYSSLKYEELPKSTLLKWNDFLVDEKLQEIVKKALSNNRDLRLAALNVERARAYYGIQRAELIPAVDAISSGLRQRVPAELSNTAKAETLSQYSVTFGITSWEIDLFGRLQSLKEMALEQYLAQEATYRAVRLSFISTVAIAYYTYAIDKENLNLAKQTLKTQQENYELIKKRYEVGVASEIDLHRAKTQVDTAREAVARYTQVLAQDRNTLELISGEPLKDELLPEGLSNIKPPKDISPGLSSEVLLNRPDIIAAEHTLKAYNAQIGAARAAFFPRISLTTLIGTASSELSGLFEAGSKTWTFQPQAVMPLFDARVWAAHEAAKVEREIAVTNYEKTIQTAFKEVADALAVKGTIDEQIDALSSLVNSLRETYKLAKIRYERGVDSYLSVLDAQRALFQAEQQLNTLILSKYANLSTLYKVLGGGE